MNMHKVALICINNPQVYWVCFSNKQNLQTWVRRRSAMRLIKLTGQQSFREAKMMSFRKLYYLEYTVSSVRQAGRQAGRQAASQPASQPVSQSVRPSVRPSGRQPTSQPASQSVISFGLHVLCSVNKNTYIDADLQMQLLK